MGRRNLYLETLVFLMCLMVMVQQKAVMSQNGPSESTDRYVPKEVEQRPWTDNTFALKKDRVPLHFMEMTHRDFQNNCDGQCFYHSGETGASTCTAQGDRTCTLIASVARHGNQQCGHIGKTMGSELNRTLCSQDQFYTITLIRKNVYPSCKMPWDFPKRMPCIPSEFVAISFYDSADSALSDKDKWYVCVAGESTVTLWRNVKTQGIQIKGTKPYGNSASGLIAAEMILRPEHGSFACRFILSANFVNEDQNIEVKLPTEDEYNGKAIKVKLAQGRVERNIVAEKDIPPSILEQNGAKTIAKNEETLAQEREYYMTQQALVRPLFVATGTGTPDETETVFGNKFEGPSPDTLDFNALQVKYVRIHPIPSDEDDESVTDAIAKQVERCDEDNHERFFECFAPNGQRNCIYRGKCPIMVIVEEPSDSTETMRKLIFRLIVFRQRLKEVKKVVRPSGWAGVGFSKDAHMGSDLVVACLTNGNDHNVAVSWNVKHNNLFDKDFNQKIVNPGAKIIVRRTRNNDKYMCEWSMNTKFEVDLSPYPLIYSTDSEGNNITKVEFDLSNSTYLLVGTGPRVYDDRRIAGHSIFYQVLRKTLVLRSQAFKTTSKYLCFHPIAIYIFYYLY